MIRRRRMKWGGAYGPTHRGWVLYVLGVPVFRRRKPIVRAVIRSDPPDLIGAAS